MTYKELLENTYNLGLSKRATNKAKEKDTVENVFPIREKIFLFLKNIASIYKKYKRTRFLGIEKNKYDRPFCGITFFSNTDSESRNFTIKELLSNIELLYTMVEKSCKMKIWLERTGDFADKNRVFSIIILLDDEMTFSCCAYYKSDYDPSKYGSWEWFDCLDGKCLSLRKKDENIYVFDEYKNKLLNYIEDYMFVKKYCFQPN